jgi:hypothetical protein
MSETSTSLHAYGVDDDVGAQSQSCSRRGSLQSNATGSLLASSEGYFDSHGNIVEKDTRLDRLRRGEEVEPEPKWDEWGALDEGDGYQQWTDIQARRGRNVPLQKPAALEPATKPKEES